MQCRPVFGAIVCLLILKGSGAAQISGFHNEKEALDAIKSEANPMQKSRICSSANYPGVKSPQDLDLVFSRLMELEKTSVQAQPIKSYQDMVALFSKSTPLAALISEVNCLANSLYLPMAPSFGAQYSNFLILQAKELPATLPGMDVFPNPGSDFDSYPSQGASMGPWVRGKVMLKLLQQLHGVANISFLARRDATSDDIEIPSLPPPEGCQALTTLKLLAKRTDMIGSRAAEVMGFCPDTSSIDFMIQKFKRKELFGINMMGLGPGILEPVMKEVDANNARGTQDGLAYTIGTIRSRQIMPKFVKLLDHPNFSVQRAAGSALGYILKPGDEELLIRMLNHPNALVQMTAENKIENGLWSERFVPIFKQRLVAGKDTRAKGLAARILGSKRIVAALPELRKAAKDPDASVRAAAKSALKQLGESQTE